MIAKAVELAWIVRAKPGVGSRRAPDPSEGPLLLEQHDLEAILHKDLCGRQSGDTGTYDAYASVGHAQPCAPCPAPRFWSEGWRATPWRIASHAAEFRR